MGTPLDLKGKHPFTPYSGFFLGTQVFTHYNSTRRRYGPNDFGSNKQQKNLKRNRDGYLKKNLIQFITFTDEIRQALLLQFSRLADFKLKIAI